MNTPVAVAVRAPGHGRLGAQWLAGTDARL
jgi:hypothetical protein